MTGNSRKKVGLASALALLAATSDAFAGGGGTIVYGPPAASIPTLSGTMLIVLGLLFAVMAFRVLRNFPGGRPLASIVALSVAGLSGVSGINVIRDAYAAVSYEMTQPNGGSLFIGAEEIDVPVSNATGRTQQIKSLNPDTYCSIVAPSSSPACTPGALVPDGNSCWVHWHCDYPT